MKHSFKDILDFCKANVISLNKVVSFRQIWGDEIDKYKEQFEMFEDKFGTVTQELCERTSDGDHDQSLLVVSIGEGKNKLYFGGYGRYSSFDGEDFDYMEVRELQPYQKVVIDWRNV
jgi:hypothetical protein